MRAKLNTLTNFWLNLLTNKIFRKSILTTLDQISYKILSSKNQPKIRPKGLGPIRTKTRPNTRMRWASLNKLASDFSRTSGNRSRFDLFSKKPSILVFLDLSMDISQKFNPRLKDTKAITPKMRKPYQVKWEKTHRQNPPLTKCD